MPDYKKMYIKMLHSSEEALRIIIAAQQECEELYIASAHPKLRITSLTAEIHNPTDKE